MTDEEFYEILNSLGDYLEMKKDFVANPPRYAEFEDAVRKAREVFPEAKIEIQNDPLEMGAMILQIEDFDLDICTLPDVTTFLLRLLEGDVFSGLAQKQLIQQGIGLAGAVADSLTRCHPRLMPRDLTDFELHNDPVCNGGVNIHSLLLFLIAGSKELW